MLFRSRNGNKFFNWTKTEADPQDSLVLSAAGDVFMGTDENGAGFEETFSFENY